MAIPVPKVPSINTKFPPIVPPAKGAPFTSQPVLAPTPTVPNQPGALSPYQAGPSGAVNGIQGGTNLTNIQSYLKNLRAQLDAGKISVSDFLKYGQPAAQQGYDWIGKIGGGGSNSANFANQFTQQFADLGFTRSADGTITPKLPQQYQQQAIESILPSGITDAQKQQYLSQLPPGLDPFSDQGKIELENLREKAQQDQTNTQQQSLRDNAITQLKGVIGQQSDIRNQGIPALQKTLNDEANRQFSLDQPGIYEDLNARGLLSSSALGEALAKQKANYTGQVAGELGQAQYQNTLQSANDLNQLSAAQLASTDQQVNAIQQGLVNSNQLQQSGLQRQFSTSDFATQAALARQIAAAQTPQSSGGGGGIAGAFTGALGGAGIGAQVGGGQGALIGGLLGAGGGYAAGQSQKKGK